MFVRSKSVIFVVVVFAFASWGSSLTVKADPTRIGWLVGNGTRDVAVTGFVEGSYQTERDQGKDCYLFGLDSESRGALADFANHPDFRLALFASTGDVWAGQEDFYLAQAAPIPEPTSMLLLGTGLIGLGAVFRHWRRSRRQ